jgi:endonuclease/exonuclease/phosphatase family metal-dependent hydrolase
MPEGRSEPSLPGSSSATDVVIATLNVHGMKQKWRRRAPVLIEALADCLPDALLLQEAARWAPQCRWLARRLSGMGSGRRYRSVAAARRDWWWFIEGLAIITRFPIVETAMLDLQGDARFAQRVTLEAPGGASFDVYNLHLAHRGQDAPLRDRQVGLLLEWLRARPGTPAIVAGDFNADPDSPAIQAMAGSLRSAHALVHGGEPRFTAPADSGPGEGRALDYIFVSEGVQVLSCDVAFGAAERDGQLIYPSDHLGLVARLRLPESA